MVLTLICLNVAASNLIWRKGSKPSNNAIHQIRPLENLSYER
jgi:hypothetical protein